MDQLKASDVIAGFVGLIGGGMAYIHYDLLGITWSFVWDRALQLLWTLFVAALSAGIGVICKKLIEENWIKIKSKFKRKKFKIMPETKWGLSQSGKPAPLWMRRLTNAMILSFLPGYVTVVQAIPMSDAKRNICMCIAAAIPFVLKGFQQIMGNGQVYSPSNEKIDQQVEKEKEAG